MTVMSSCQIMCEAKKKCFHYTFAVDLYIDTEKQAILARFFFIFYFKFLWLYLGFVYF